MAIGMIVADLLAQARADVILNMQASPSPTRKG